MKLMITGYVWWNGKLCENVYIAREISSKTENWERILRKMYAATEKRIDESTFELFAVMVNEDGHHECSQAWAIEWNSHYPKCEFPFL